MRILSDLNFGRTPALRTPTIATETTLPTDAVPGTLIYDAARQRLRLRVEGGWVTLNASGFTPD